MDESEEVHVYGSILQVSTWLLEEDPANESPTLLNHAVHHTSVLPNCLSRYSWDRGAVSAAVPGCVLIASLLHTLS